MLSWETVLVNEEVGFGPKSPRRWSNEECLLGLAKQRSEGVVSHPRKCSKRFY